MLPADDFPPDRSVDYATTDPSLPSGLRRIGIPLASSDPRVPLFNLSILDRRVDSLRRFLSGLLQRNASIRDEQIDLVSEEIGASIQQIIMNGAALLGSSQNQDLGPGLGGLTASVSEDAMDLTASSASAFAAEVNDRIKRGKASNSSDLCDLTGRSAYLADLELLRDQQQQQQGLRIPSAEEKVADLKFSYCSDSRNLVDLKVVEKAASSSSTKVSSDSRDIHLKIALDQAIHDVGDGSLFDLAEMHEISTISRKLSGNMVDLKLPFSSDSKNLRFTGDDEISAAGDRNLIDLKVVRESRNPAADGARKDEDDAAAEDADAEIIELDSVELLAEHMHFCEICGKGFKRDANLRMHKRAHGNQFKTIEALSKPDRSDEDRARKIRFSCPFAGCNRNKAHKRFRPLKSALCVKNHFKRSHCPKMYSCNRCNKKSFSVVSDLKSHLKHCGECRWRCSCGTSFSRKDKLFGHVALFEGHMPAILGEDQPKEAVLEEGMQVDREEHIENADAEGSDSGFFEGLLEGFSGIDAGSLDDLLGFL